MGRPVSDGHLWTADEWRAVVVVAEREAVRIAAGIAAPEAPEVRGFATGLLPLSGVVTAARHGGRRPAPTFGVIHSAETPLRAGYAASIARMFATTTQDKSCHYMTDPAETWGVLDDLLVAWHVGGANPNSLGLEQAGLAAMTRAQWLVPDGYAQMRRNADVMRAARDRFGIGLYWMTDAQLLAAHRRQIVGGWATHDQCRRVIGGTTHTDPGKGFPFDVQMQIAVGDAGEDYDVSAVEAKLDDLLDRMGALQWVVAEPADQGSLLARVGGVQAQLARVLTVLGEQGDATELARELVPVLVPALTAALGELDRDGEPITQEQLEAALRTVLGSLA